MGREIGYCGECGVRVQAADDQGVLLGGRLYCSTCLPQGSYDPRPLPEARPAAPRPLPRVRASSQRTRRRKPTALIGAAALLALVLAAVAWPRAQSYPEELRPPPANLPGRIVAPPAANLSGRIVAPPTAPAEGEAEELYRDYEETALGLAGEGRIDGALKKIETFPLHLRDTRAWKSLEALRRSLEARR